MQEPQPLLDCGALGSLLGLSARTVQSKASRDPGSLPARAPGHLLRWHPEAYKEWALSGTKPRKRGRNPAFPYVPIVRYAHEGRRQTVNPTRRVAFETRAEAAAFAQRHIDDLKAAIKAQLAEPRYRALREQYGLPRELVV